MKSTKAVTDAKVELANTKEACCALEGRASADRVAMRSAVEGCDRVQGEFATTSTKNQAAKAALIAKFDQLK